MKIIYLRVLFSAFSS